MKNFIFISFTLIMLSACSQTKYVAHVAKQIPMPQDTAAPESTVPAPEHVGYFKVGSSYVIKGRRYQPTETYNHTETGTASWYGPGFHGKQTANGEIFDENEMTAAHRTLQLPSIIQVTNLENGRQVVLRVNDRGPFAHERILDVSKRGAEMLGFKNKGVAKIRLEVLADASKEVASMARNKQSTKGMEIAYNNSSYVTQPADQFQSELKYASNTAVHEPAPLRQEQYIPEYYNTPQPVITHSGGPTHLPQINSQQLAIEPYPSELTPVQQIDTIVQEAIQPNSTTTSADIVRHTSSGKSIYVQAGAFSKEASAFAHSNKLTSVDSFFVTMKRAQDRTLYHVRSGPYASPQEAQKVVNTLNESGRTDAVLVIE